MDRVVMLNADEVAGAYVGVLEAACLCQARRPC